MKAQNWFFHKHAAGVYSAEPRGTGLAVHDREDGKSPAVGDPPVSAAHAFSGTGTLETYTVVFTREGGPDYAILYGRTEDGRRFVAGNRPGDEGALSWLTAACRVGRGLRIFHDPRTGQNRASLP